MPETLRTTITLAPDVAAAVAARQREENAGISAVVNDLLRRALVERPVREPFVQRTSKMGLLIDVRNVQEALDIAEGPWRK